eukprot:TRINITY_DN40431_c0_g1_i3.p2 TRINITY_DN40431_c0_g1~~TRINITY_DN40431_c0_g1_i3.p2  ORF type:complete len:157 (+),score=30.54 TRINITY_DN40431_c0_g1_i3:29-499(+)
MVVRSRSSYRRLPRSWCLAAGCATALSLVWRRAERPLGSQGLADMAMTMAAPAAAKRKFHFGDIYKNGNPPYEPRHEQLFKNGEPNWNTWLTPSFQRLVEAAKHGNPTPFMTEEMPGVYSFDMLTDEFCDLLLEEVEHAKKTRDDDLDQPNGMGSC